MKASLLSQQKTLLDELDPPKEKKLIVQTQFLNTMKNYLNRNISHFNPSQLNVLTSVSQMAENEILLIQGPPGTGKTHTIQGLISMLVGRKVMICAPSNFAIDEVI